MSNAALNFLSVLKRTIKGDPYPALQGQSFEPISYVVANVSDPLVGVTLSQRYVVSQRIGAGSMSIVYSAVQNPIDRIVAIKMLKREFTDEPLTVKRFYREATAVSKLKHQNILTIHDVGETDDGVPYFVMEYLEGVSLAQLVEKYGAIHYLRALPIFAQICNAMAHSHRQGIIHRDLKPSNIMLTEEDGKQDFVKLVDFGIVLVTKQSQRVSQKLTQAGEIWGSPYYMSPEQCTGTNIDARSDIYSMGMVMYEILVGRPAFEEKNIGRIVNKHLKEMPLRFVESAPGKAIPESVEEVVFRCIQKNPDKRYQTMEELELAIQPLMPRRSNISYQGLKPPAGIDLGNEASRPQMPPPRRETTTEIPPFASSSSDSSNNASNSDARNVRDTEPKRNVPPPIPSARSLSNTSGGFQHNQATGRDGSGSKFDNRSAQSEDNGVEEVVSRKKSFDEVKGALTSSQPEQKSSTGIYVLIASALVILLLFFGGIGFALNRFVPVFSSLAPLMESIKTVVPQRPTGAGVAGDPNSGSADQASNNVAPIDNSAADPNQHSDAQTTDSSGTDNGSATGNDADNTQAQSQDSGSSEQSSGNANSGGTTAGVTLSGQPVIIPGTARTEQNPGEANLPSNSDQNSAQNPARDLGNNNSAPVQPQLRRTAPVGQRAQVHSGTVAPTRTNSVRINRKNLAQPSDDDDIEQMYLRKKKHRGDAQQQWHDYSDSENSDDG